ncbi:hypothetical protein CJO79_23350 (plasmid) [Ralstonia solanacearum]|nr:hypothetical protein CJO76_23370 [Ralstonia solanacearum]AXV93838.1 hypothetical protein CJO79_23350 [Ralstonia solanacearum]AXW21830.1 hypothetical protein CJO85_23475 [Ralstonia solanacearum]AXW78731.1 hypothetical protein CJO97_23350 [Ralstonia solanacearum]
MVVPQSSRSGGTVCGRLRPHAVQACATATLARWASALSTIGIIDMPLPSIPQFRPLAFADVPQISFCRKREWEGLPYCASVAGFPLGCSMRSGGKASGYYASIGSCAGQGVERCAAVSSTLQAGLGGQFDISPCLASAICKAFQIQSVKSPTFIRQHEKHHQ